MSRREYDFADDFHDDADDYRGEPPPRKKSGSNPALIIALVVGGVAVLGFLVCGGLFMARIGDVQVQAPANAPPVAHTVGEGTKRIYTREEFRQILMGNSPEGVLASVGKPDKTQEIGDEPIWYYNNRTKDPVSGKIDSSAQVIFEQGVVVKVNY